MKKFRNRLTVAFLLLIGLAVGVLGVLGNQLIGDAYTGALSERLTQEVRLLTKTVAWTEDVKAMTEQAVHVGTALDARVTFVRADGTVLGDSHRNPRDMGNHRDRPEIRQALNSKAHEGKAVRYSATIANEQMYIALPIVRGGGTVGVVRASLALASIHEASRQFGYVLAIGLLLLTAAAALLSMWFARGITRPLEAMTRLARKITQGDFSRASAHDGVEVNRRDELGELARAIDHLSFSLQQQLETIRASEQRLKSVIETMPSGLLLIEVKEGVSWEVENGTFEKKRANNSASGEITRRALREVARGTRGTPEEITHHAAKEIDSIGTSSEKKAGCASQADERHGTFKIVLTNPAIEQLLRLSADDVVGKSYTALAPYFDLRPQLAACIRTGASVREEIHLFAPEERILEASLSPLKDEAGHIDGVVAVLHDLTAVRRLEQLRRDFVANVSHELKTPVTSVIGFAETLLDGAMDDAETCRSFLQIIHEESLRLYRLIGDILDLSKIESRELSLKVETCDMSALIRSSAQSLQGQMEQAGLTLSLSLPEELVVEADKDRMRQIVVNLVSNAIAYTPEGGEVKVALTPAPEGVTAAEEATVANRVKAAKRATVADDATAANRVRAANGATAAGGVRGANSAIVPNDATDANGATAADGVTEKGAETVANGETAVNSALWQLTVSDTGVGIPPEHLPRIFERFYRVDKARSRALGGTGLGLAIVKHLVEVQKGTIDVESTVGIGTTFRLTFPRTFPRKK